MEPIEVSQTVFGVPPSHLHCTFKNFKWPSPEVQSTVQKFLQLLELGTPQHLLMTGSNGTGKTHLAVAIYRWAVLRWGTLLCSFVPVTRFFSEVKATFDDANRREESPFRDVEDARRVVVLDDLLDRVPTPWEVDHIIFRLISTVYTNNASLIISTNQPMAGLKEVLKPHELSRILENVIQLEFHGVDNRLPR